MVGDRDLKIDQEEIQPEPRPRPGPRGLGRRPPAQRHGVPPRGSGRAVLDDHLALNNAGIPTIDIIDFDYPYWHTSQDLPERCSAASLEQVGRVLTAWLAQPKRAR